MYNIKIYDVQVGSTYRKIYSFKYSYDKVSPKETRRKKEKLNIITQKKGNKEEKSIAWERKNRGKTKNTKAGFWKRWIKLVKNKHKRQIPVIGTEDGPSVQVWKE